MRLLLLLSLERSCPPGQEAFLFRQEEGKAPTQIPTTLSPTPVSHSDGAESWLGLPLYSLMKA
jgi:hypothetical protein